MRARKRSKRFVGVLIASVVAVVVPLAVPASASAVTLSPAPLAAAFGATSDAPSEEQFQKLDKIAKSNSGFGVYGSSDPVLTLPADASAGEQAKAAAEIPAGVKATVKISQFTKAEVDEIQKTAMERNWSSDAKKYGVSASYDGTTDTVTIATDAPPSATKSLLRSYPGAVKIERARFEPQDTRFLQFSPFMGGGSISAQEGVCTSAFAIKSKATGSEYMLTANHCYPQSRQVTAASGFAGNIGTVWQKYQTVDVEVIGGANYSGYIFTGGFRDSIAVTRVSSEGSGWVGLQVCVSGQTTFNHCGHPVSNTNANVCYPSGSCISNNQGFLYDRGGTNGPCWCNGTMTEPGDSGAPIFTWDNGAARIRGVHSGIIYDSSGVAHMIGTHVHAALGVTNSTILVG